MFTIFTLRPIIHVASLFNKISANVFFISIPYAQNRSGLNA